MQARETKLIFVFFVSEPSGPSAESSTLRVHHLKIKPPNFPFAQKTTLDEKCELYASAAHSIIRLNKQITISILYLMTPLWRYVII